jgi:O-antigen ligase
VKKNILETFIIYTYILSIFIFGFKGSIVSIKLDQAISLFLLIIFLIIILCIKKIKKIPFFYFAIFALFITSSIVNYSLVGYHQITGYLNYFLFMTTSLLVISFFDIHKILKVYLNFTIAFCVIALVQEALYLINIDLSFFKLFLTTNNITSSGIFLRVFSLTREPSHFALLLLPVILIIIDNLIEKKQYLINKFQSVIIFSSFLLTFSTTAYSYIVFFIILKFFLSFSFKKAMYIISMFVPLIFFLASLPAVSERLESLHTIITIDDSTNSSAFAIQSNLFVALNVIADSPFLGHGIFTHLKSYHEYISSLYHIGNDFVFLNVRDASSLYIRYLSELGVVGIVFYVFYILFKIIQYKDDKFVFIFGASLLLYGLRFGNIDVQLYWFLFSLFLVSCENKKKINLIKRSNFKKKIVIE